MCLPCIHWKLAYSLQDRLQNHLPLEQVGFPALGENLCMEFGEKVCRGT